MQTGTDEWRRGWSELLCATLCMSATALPFYTIGVFMEPLHQEFGWSRLQLSTPPLFLSLITALLAPLVGGLADRTGNRLLAVGGLVVTCASFAALAFTNGSLVFYYALWVCVALGISFSGPMVLTMGLPHLFNRHRGTAIAIAMSGVNLFGAAAPVAVSLVSAAWGWRVSYAALGLGVGLFCVPLAAALLPRKVRSSAAPTAIAAPSAAPAPGYDVRSALRTRAFWLIGLGLVLNGSGVVSLMVHLVPALTDRGVSLEMAAAVASVLAIAAILGGLLSGYLMDRMFLPHLAAIIFALPVVSCWLLLQPGMGLPGYFLAAILTGISSSGAVNLVAMLGSRYFGPRAFGSIYGLLFALFSLAQGPTAMLLGAIRDQSGSYRPAFWGLAAAFAISALAMPLLGRYPKFEAVPAE